MNSVNNQATDVELETVDTSYWADQLSAYERLLKNPDFKAVIQEGYIKIKALDSVSMLAHPDVKKRGERSDVMEDLIAISNLQYHFFMIEQLGAGARQDALDALDEE